MPLLVQRDPRVSGSRGAPILQAEHRASSDSVGKVSAVTDSRGASAESATLRMAPRVRRKRTQPWHAVGIQPRGNVCPQALALLERRFLCEEAPKLPLEGCPLVDECGCVYRHYADRRQGPRRSVEQTGYRGPSRDTERRAGRGRRKSDAL